MSRNASSLKHRLIKPAMATKSGAALAALICSTSFMSSQASAQVLDLCTGLRANVPVLQPVAGGFLDPLLNGLVANINTNLLGALSGQTLGISALDQNGNLISLPGNCRVAIDDVTVNANKGITLGGGKVDGLGGPTNPVASAGEVNSIAIGNGAATSATALNAIAVGLRGSVTATDGIAIGRDASVAGAGGVAIGAGASATQANSTAIGAGATTTRANQVAIGTAQNTYTMAGVASAQSAAAQRGPTRLLTTDAQGNIAASNIDINGMDLRITSLESEVRNNRKEARQGIAAAMAMDTAPMPSAPGRTSWAMNTATFKGEFAGGFSFAHRLNTARPFAITGSYGNGGGNTHGGRVGLAGEF